MKQGNQLKNRSLFGIIGLFWLMPFFVLSQGIKNDLLAITRHVSTLKKYSVTLEYSMFLDLNLSKPISTKKVTIWMDNANYAMSIPNETELIETKNEYIMVDHKRKQVFYNRAKVNIKSERKEEEEEFQEALKFFEMNYDSLLEGTAVVKQLFYQHPIKTYEVNYLDGEYSKAVYTVDVDRKLYKSIMIVYADPEIVYPDDQIEHIVSIKVDYINFETKPSIPKTTFDITKFVEKISNKYVLKSDYKNYKLQVF